jgi:hypothetical protein
MFAQLNIDDEDDQQQQPVHRPIVKTNDQPVVTRKVENRPIQLHPGSPLSPAQNSLSISVSRLSYTQLMSVCVLRVTVHQ